MGWAEFFKGKKDEVTEPEMYNITVDTSSANYTTMHTTNGYTLNTTGTVTTNSPNSTYVNGGFYGTSGVTYNSTIPSTGYYTGNLGGSTNYQSASIYVYGTNPTISTDQTKIDINELGELMKTLKERLLIIVPNFEKHEKYEALKKAYDHYKLIEKMIGEENVNNISK